MQQALTLAQLVEISVVQTFQLDLVAVILDRRDDVEREREGGAAVFE
jgi:hypothetical protein